MSFVLDNSVAMRWLLASSKKSDQSYAEKVLKSMTTAEAYVPNLWHLEAVNVLLSAKKRLEIDSGEVEIFISQLENLPIHVDVSTVDQAFNRIIALADAYKLSSYDAAYFELAIREGLPIATLNKDLNKAAKKAGIEIYLS